MEKILEFIGRNKLKLGNYYHWHGIPPRLWQEEWFCGVCGQSSKINSKGEEEVLNLIYDLTTDVLTKETKPEFVKVETGVDTNKRKGDIRVYVGTIPDFSSKADGYKISGVKPGGPADNGGLQGGDVIIKFASKDIKNIYDFTYALKLFTPNDVVDVIVMRGDEKLILIVFLGRK